MNERSYHGKAVSAFALLDLLAVCTVVLLLVCMVPPALDGARLESKHNTCLDRLRAIGAATAIYSASDPNEQALPVHSLFAAQDPANPSFIGAYEWGGKSGVGRPDYIDGVGVGVIRSKYGTQAGFGPSTRPLNDILYPHGFRDNTAPQVSEIGAILDTKLDLPVYRCPGDDGPPLGAHCADWLANPTQSSYDHFGTSYAANLFMIGAIDGGPMLSNSPFLRSLSSVPDPARTINYEENIGRWAWASRREIDDCQSLIGLIGVDPGPTKLIRGWHNKPWTFNQLYVDGHADRRLVYIHGTRDANSYSEHYYSEQVFEDEEQQQFSQCLIIRGDGWQKDTLPDAPIETELQWTGVGRPSYEDCVQTN